MKGYDIKVRLNRFRPHTWRDMIVPANMTFEEFDDALKTIWGFDGSHSSCFLINGGPRQIMDKDFDMMGDVEYDSKTTRLDDVFSKNIKITYWYDFGDDWKFDIEIKKMVEYDEEYITLKRFKGKYNPIEDCGGVGSLMIIIECSENPEYMEDDELIDYIELVDEVTEFDMDYVQKRLKEKNYVINPFIGIKIKE